ncbi:unnamed protein product, partial [Brachionus calyciflorus]
NKCLSEIKENNLSLKQFMNSTTTGSHTLLFRACRNSNSDIVKILLDSSSIAKPHYYTKYSPLYIACHMGNEEIAKLLLEKFPHLIQVETIEKFLPFHAVCSQGHIQILKLLIDFNLKSLKTELKQTYSKNYINHLEKIFSNPNNPIQKYELLFDLNSLDVNDQTGLHHAVLNNQYIVCDFLLKLKIKQISESKAKKYELKNQQITDIFTNESFQLSIASSKSSNDSFLDQLKSVFLDTKSYDPYYTVNYSVEDSKSENENKSDDDTDSESDIESENQIYFNPININQYSKYGLTCLHESIRSKNIKILDLLIRHGADPNLPILDSNLVPVSTSLNEALKTQDDKIFYLILKNSNLTDENFKNCLNSCIGSEFGFKVISYLFIYKISDDLENKITLFKNKLVDSGLILNLAQLNLTSIYESWILNSILNYKIDWIKTSGSFNLKKIHLNTITRIDLSNNCLELLPIFLFQIESLKFLKLSFNKLKSLPFGYTEFDNISVKRNPSYTCNQLEELELDFNLLIQIPNELFGLKNLKRLNLSNNLIDSLPIDLWQSGLVEINLAYNRLSNLPVVNSCTQSRGRKETKRNIQPQKPTPIIKPKNTDNELITNYRNARVDKANFWTQNSNIFVEIELDEDLDSGKKTHKNFINQSKLLDLNLSHNNLKKIPECLSCVAPKLSKLNLSHNLIESMGAISDLPANLKFLDLSNNLITDSVRLLNSNFLKFVELYWLNKAVDLKKLDYTLLDNQFCYLNLGLNRLRSQREKSIQVNLRSSSNRRRARSQSRNPARNSLQINSNFNDKKLPFDLFLMNFKYRRIENENELVDFDEIHKFSRENFLNSQNIQIFLEQMCHHKRHIKLENLKSLNLSNNKIKKLDLMFDLSGSQTQEIDSEDEENKNLKSPKKSLIFKSKNEERINNISKLLYPNLTHLDISNNLINRLSGSISYIENLSHLNAASNFELQKISPKLGLLTKLWNLDLKSCPSIKDVQLDSLIRQKTKTSDILGYLKSILDNSRPYNRVKLMFVGVQAIGKTTLLNKLREESGYSSPKNNLSTVGIDINEWTYERPKNAKPIQEYFNVYMEQNSKNFGPITFRTWDFAGQKEYYTTHQYFISKRAIYLVCWKMTEEEKGINEIHHWLSNIQTRAPGSPCIIVGTHQDQLVKLKNYKDISNSLQRKIYEKFILPNSDSETTSAAYPPILASIEISSKTSHNIKLLARIIYDVASQIKVPGMKDQLLLEQKIPSTYLALEECVHLVVKKMRLQSLNPVLKTQDYLIQIQEAISYLYPDEDQGKLAVRFRDNSEILQATQFLHDNGILIHYNDVALNDLFFLDPQWLCDILSTVVAIREINPFAAKGIMKINDLQVLFKGSKNLKSESDEIMSYITDLLGKFELALTWDNEHLLIPSLLPSEPMLKYSNQDIRISIMSKEKLNSLLNMNNLVQSVSCFNSFESQQTTKELENLYSNIKLANSYSQNILSNKLNLEFLYECKALDENDSLRRLYTLSYLPSGFFSRLISRILSDSLLKECLLDLIEIEQCDKLDFKLIEFLSQEAEWKCWQTGIELKYLDFSLFRVKEVIQDPLIDLESNISKKNIFIQNSVLFQDCENELKLKTLNKQYCSFLECYATMTSYKITKSINGKSLDDEGEILININLNKQVIIKIFALIIEIIDSLLEDWYPDLGTRFMQDSKGDYLVTRLAPCENCVKSYLENNFVSQEKKKIFFDLNESDLEKLKQFENFQWIYCFMLDDVCYSVLKNSHLICVRHGEQDTNKIAPDLAFKDIEQKYLITQDNLKIEKILGRGSFGSVFSGVLFTPYTSDKVKVAVKVLETFNPNQTEVKNFNIFSHRKSIRLAAKAYSIARQEIAILSSLKNEQIVSMMGLCIKPLAIILELAPLGNLKDLILSYKKTSLKLNPCVIQQVCVQISSALVYLHSNRIIYRDLKADNVLVWKFPMPNQISSNLETLVKLADYSISRSVLPTGTKGFAGTPGFMAPEILKYNGEETYSEKVDSFSYSMLLYELITLRHPYEGQEQIKDIVLNGGRPIVRNQDLNYPSLMLDLMCLCWMDSPSDRPSSNQILKYTQSFEFSHLIDVTILEDYNEAPLVVACLNQENDEFEIDDNRNEDEDDSDLEEIEEEDLIDVWVVRNKNELDDSVAQIEILTYESKLNCTSRKVANLSNHKIEALCHLNKSGQIWFVDSNKTIFVYCCKTYKKVNQYILDINLETSGKIVSIHPIEQIKQIILITSKGLILYLYLNEASLHKELNNNEEFKYFIQDLTIDCYTSLLLPSRYDNKSYDLWLGSSKSEVFIYSLKNMKLIESYLHTSSHHFLTNSNLNLQQQSPTNKTLEFNFQNQEQNEESNELNVVILKTTQIDTFFLWSYVYPGSTIYLWNHVSKKIMSAYNCRKSFEENEQASQLRDFRIVEIEFMNSHLYCGINNGTVLVLKRLTLTPLQMFNSHMHQLYNLCSLQFETRLNTWSRRNKQNMTSQVKKTQHMLLTMGRALSSTHEDMYLSNPKYRIDALQNYANCLILNAWNCNYD